MIVEVDFPEGLAARVPADCASELLTAYCAGVSPPPLPDYDPGPGADVLSVEIAPAAASGIGRAYPGVSLDSVIRRVLAANAKPEPPKAPAPRPNPAPPNPKLARSHETSPMLVVLLSMLAPVAGIIVLIILLRFIRPSGRGGGFDEWPGGQ
jgi:hypothetical protein